ncbi:MAG: purine-nucleoside phosphorylase [Desulfamplus sp.]|nr:purine-nucleoside phosphorylase [Desulfamplus sp.]
MQRYKDSVIESVNFIKNRINPEPYQIAFLIGTGLGECTASMDLDTKFRYQDIPNFPVSTVESHKGELIFGTMCNKKIVVMQGRFHLYEGYSPLQVTFPIRVMQELGVKYLIISNASGGLNLGFATGDVMVIRDHINLTANNPLVGANVDSWGVRFPDMSEVYDKNLANIAIAAAKKAGVAVHYGIYAGLCGPSLETPAEMRFLKTIGADAVGFSTVMEAIVGVHAGMKIVGIATITNINNPDVPHKATVEDIIKAANYASKDIYSILAGILESIS